MKSLQSYAEEFAPTFTESSVSCEKHGDYTAKTYPAPFPTMKGHTTGCPACAEERRSAEEAERTERDRLNLQAYKRGQIEHLLGRCGIPPRFADKSFDNYAPASPAARVALTAARKYAEAFDNQSRQGRSLVLAGGPGTGKTHLAAAIGQHVIRAFQAAVLFGTVSQALRRIKDTYRKDSETTESQVIETMTSCDLLILDEIGAQIGSEHEKQLMFEILNERYQGMRSTILISNLNSAELETFLGHRVMDRYRECGVILAFDWASHRGAKAELRNPPSCDEE
jgi:DNA replication protein DnaC